MPVTCSRCGTSSPDDLRFCPACGQALAAADASPAPAVPVADHPAKPSTPMVAEAFDHRRRRLVVGLLVAGIAILAAVLALRPGDEPQRKPGPQTSPVAAPPVAGTPGTAAPPVAAKWQRVDSIALGLVPYGKRTSAGVSFEVPADWKRLDMPEAFIIGFAPVGAVEGVSPRVLVSAMDLPAEAPLADEAAVVKSMADDGGARFALRGEGARRIAGHEAWRLSIAFKAMDDPDLRRQELVFVRIGGTAFKILVDGADANVDVGRAFDHIVETLAVKE